MTCVEPCVCNIALVSTRRWDPLSRDARQCTHVSSCAACLIPGPRGWGAEGPEDTTGGRRPPQEAADKRGSRCLQPDAGTRPGEVRTQPGECPVTRRGTYSANRECPSVTRRGTYSTGGMSCHQERYVLGQGECPSVARRGTYSTGGMSFCHQERYVLNRGNVLSPGEVRTRSGGMSFCHQERYVLNWGNVLLSPGEVRTQPGECPVTRRGTHSARGNVLSPGEVRTRPGGMSFCHQKRYVLGQGECPSVTRIGTYSVKEDMRSKPNPPAIQPHYLRMCHLLSIVN